MKFYILTFGCQQNIADSQRISSLLISLGLTEVNSLKSADIFVINSCSVRQAAEDKVYGLANKVKAWRGTDKRKLVILTGCMSGSALSERKRFPLSYLRNKAPWVDYFWKIDDFEERAKENFEIVCTGYSTIQYPIPSTHLVPITSGCDNFCSYCVVPYARGPEHSRPIDEIITEAKKAVSRGTKEIMLLGQNVNSFVGECDDVSIHKYKESFPRLLSILNEISGLEKISFMTSHPKDMSDELIDAIANLPKISKDVHLPMQSGDNEILKKMNRGYTVEYYLGIVKKLRKKVKGIRLSTDIIVGFPGETEKQFENTISAFKKAKFDHAFIAMYSLRPGTAAARMKDDVPLSEKRRRHKLLFDLF